MFECVTFLRIHSHTVRHKSFFFELYEVLSMSASCCSFWWVWTPRQSTHEGSGNTSVVCLPVQHYWLDIFACLFG